jgi:N-ethylmaleimide reductase
MTILFEPITIGPYELNNRIVMAPVSRNRANKSGVMPEFAADYYSQRATAGLIIAESTEINDWSNGMNAPGIYRQEHVDAWKNITDAVHAEGGIIFSQLWHAGRASHKSLNPDGRDVAGPSAIAISREIMTYQGLQKATTPRAFTLDEIIELRADHKNAMQKAKEAGFDGIEVHAANGYLIDQFLQDASNQRDDQYGGSVENRARFLMEVLEDAIELWGPDRVGVRISPTSDFNEISDSDTLGTFSYIIRKLDKSGLAYLHIVEQLPWSPVLEENATINDKLRKLWSGTLISNGGFDAVSGAKHISSGKANAISYGRPFIANPDLPARFKANAPLANADESTIYGGNHQGYSDYPNLEELNKI